MRRAGKRVKAKGGAKLPVAKSSRNNESSRVRDLEKRLAEALKQEAEAQEQQTATAEILHVISASPTDTQPVFDTIAQRALRVCGGTHCAVMRLDGALVDVAAHSGMCVESVEELRRIYPLPLSADTLAVRSIREGKVIHSPDMSNDPSEPVRRLARVGRYRSGIHVPMLRGGSAVGVISVGRSDAAGGPRPFTEKETTLLQTFADQAVIAIENVRLFNETKDALEQQTATAEILRVISQAQAEVQPVFEAIADSAMQLFGAWSAAVYRYEGGLIRMAAARGGLPRSGEAVMEQLQAPRRPTEDDPQDRAAVTRAVQHVVDAETDPAWGPRFRERARLRGFRSALAVPMLQGEDVVGVIAVSRDRVGGFAPAEIALLQTFADQAVIAVENVRLFQELQARTHELAQSVDELKALGEVSQTISSTLDLDTVLTTIVVRAVQLSAASGGGVIYEYDDVAEEFRLRATHGMEAALSEALQGAPIRLGEGAMGQAGLIRAPVQAEDITDERAVVLARVRPILMQSGYRSLLAVPLLLGQRIMGGLVVWRRESGPFDPGIVNLLQTFATHSVLAIQNARLFREIADASRQLEAASRHKSEFLANMSHELRTPLNAILGFSEVLAERMFGDVNEKQAEYLQDILSSGRHLLSLINDILDLSKVEAGRLELELAPFHLPTALDNAVTLVRERATRHGIRLTQTVAEGVGDVVADERKVKQILLNLLSNAVKFTSEGGRVGLTATAAEGVITIAVSDTGIGIAPEDQAAVFEEFRQVGRDDARKQEGTGLGLTLTKKFVELHGGRIWVQSALGQGSTFILTLPVRHEARSSSDQGGGGSSLNS